ncbi:MAG: PTS sugar transporter subunit IIB [Oscillospiraceae bacterium]|nr:PTS sugar transporter subunit IIB [Oscillospiraceae bacterium]
MKQILLACGTGICTTTIATKKLEMALNEKGWAGKYKITQCKVTEVPNLSPDFDLCVATTPVAGEVQCPVIIGAPALLTGIGLDPIISQIVDVLSA